MVILHTYQEGFAALDTIKSALTYITGQFSLEMTRPEAVAHFETRKILIRRYMALLDEMELEFTYGECPDDQR